MRSRDDCSVPASGWDARCASLAKRLLSRSFLPPDPHVQEPYRLTPKLALRVGLLGTLALAVFAVLFLRLWSLQILNGEQLLRAAQNNQRRDVRIQAPRGSILDRNGQVLVTNVPGTAVQIWASDLPKRRGVRLREIRALARVLQIPALQIGRTLRRHRNDPLTPVKVKEGVTEAQVGYLKERADDFPGVRIANTYLRYYPHRELAAHLLGYVSEISAEQLKEMGKQGYRSGDTIGQSGIESFYDKYLRGTPGLSVLRVDSLGRRRGPVTPKVPPHAGNAVRLTLDLKLQLAAEDALRYGLERARNSGCYGCWNANGGAIVALDPRTGAVRALASYPTYAPSLYAGRVRSRARCSGADVAQCAGDELPRPRPRDRRRLSAGFHVQARDGDRGDGGAHSGALRVTRLHRRVREERPDLQELGSVRERGDDLAHRARQVMRHVLLPSRLPLLRHAVRARPSVAGVGKPLRFRSTNGDRPRARAVGPAPDSRLAQEDVHEEDGSRSLADRQPVEAGRLDPARHRPEGSPRHADADGALLRDGRARRPARDPAASARRRAAVVERTARAYAADASSAGARTDQRRCAGPGRCQSGSVRGDALFLRDVCGDLQRVSDPHLGQDRYGREADRSGRRLSAHLQPVLVVRLRPVGL